MSGVDLIAKAAGFLVKNDIDFVQPGKIGRDSGDRVEVIFPVPETLDPNVAVIDPADVRVWISKDGNRIELMHQM